MSEAPQKNLNQETNPGKWWRLPRRTEIQLFKNAQNFVIWIFVFKILIHKARLVSWWSVSGRKTSFRNQFMLFGLDH